MWERRGRAKAAGKEELKLWAMPIAEGGENDIEDWNMEMNWRKQLFSNIRVMDLGCLTLILTLSLGKE